MHTILEFLFLFAATLDCFSQMSKQNPICLTIFVAHLYVSYIIHIFVCHIIVSYELTF